MGALRLEIAKRDDLLSDDDFKPVWIMEFPQFEKDEKSDKWVFLHHPFTSPREEDLELLDNDPGAVKSRAYDLVINGYEIAGGSIRNHNPKVQMKILDILGIPEKEANEKFGFLLEALTYGAPPPLAALLSDTTALSCFLPGLIRSAMLSPSPKLPVPSALWMARLAKLRKSSWMSWG